MYCPDCDFVRSKNLRNAHGCKTVTAPWRLTCCTNEMCENVMRDQVKLCYAWAKWGCLYDIIKETVNEFY